MRITVLGGYGNAGVEIVRLASRFTDHGLTIAGRSTEKATASATDLSVETGKAIGWCRCDASSEHDVSEVVANCDLLLIASSTTHLTSMIADVCLRSGTHYLDIGLSTAKKWEALRRVERQIESANLLFIADGGFHPGLPGVLIRYAQESIPRLESALVAGSFALDWKRRTFSAATEVEFIDELRLADLSVWKDGRFAKGYRHARMFDFGGEIGSVQCIPMMMQEIRDAVTDIDSLRNAGFFVSGFGPVVDYLVMPICMAGGALGNQSIRNFMSRFFMWGLERFASERERAVVQLEASGSINGELQQTKLRVAHDDPYILTAAPVVSCLRQLETATIKPGLFTQAGWLNPSRTLADLRETGIFVEIMPSVVPGDQTDLAR